MYVLKTARTIHSSHTFSSALWPWGSQSRNSRIPSPFSLGGFMIMLIGRFWQKTVWPPRRGHRKPRSLPLTTLENLLPRTSFQHTFPPYEKPLGETSSNNPVSGPGQAALPPPPVPHMTVKKPLITKWVHKKKKWWWCVLLHLRWFALQQ